MKLFIEYIDNKFINNILLSNIPDKIKILSSEINQDIYKIHDIYKLDSYIFNANHLLSNNKDIIQFINEHHSAVKIIFYHSSNDTIDKYVDSINLSNVRHIGHIDNSSSNYTKIPYLLNKDLFFNRHLDNKQQKIACFIDDKKSLPLNLSQILYPNTNLPIIIFGNIIHPQCLGKITEQEKPIILNNFEYYLCIHDNYLLEASECGCKIFTTESIIESKAMIDIDTTNIKTYSEFVEELVLS